MPTADMFHCLYVADVSNFSLCQMLRKKGHVNAYLPQKVIALKHKTNVQVRRHA